MEDPGTGRFERHDAEVRERRRQARGLLMIAVVVVLLSIWRAGWHHVFTPGWWRLW